MPLERLPTLDGWRAVAILAVLLCHSTFLFSDPGVAAAVSYLRLGVDLFFAISGFLITYRLLGEAEQRGTWSLRGFYLRRACRILPAYALYLAVLALLAATGRLRVAPWEWWSSILFVRNYEMALPGGTATNHLWSLAVEEHFYLLWPLLLLLLKPRRARVAAPLLALLIHLWRALDMRYGLFARHVPISDAGALFRSDTRMDALLWGCTLALVYPALRGALQRCRPWASGLTAAILALLVAAIVVPFRMLPLWFALGFPALIASTVALPRGAVGRVLETPLLRWIGDRSYSLYLWQTLFLQCAGVSLHLTLATSRRSAIAFWLGDLVLLFACATASYRFVERPAVRFGQRLAAKGPGQDPLPQPLLPANREGAGGAGEG